MHCLTKWPEAFAISNQKAKTIAKLFVEQIVLDKVYQKNCSQTEVSTSFLTLCREYVGYWMSRRLTRLVTTLRWVSGEVQCYSNQHDCEVTFSIRSRLGHLSAVFAIGWVPRNPLMSRHFSCCMVEMLVLQQRLRDPCSELIPGDYWEDLLSNLSLAWKLAAENIQRAQKLQKHYYDCCTRKVNLRVDDRVMVYMPSEVQGEECKLRWPFYGPYRVLSVTDTNVEVHLVDSHTEDPIFVNLNHVRLCHPAQGDVT